MNPQSPAPSQQPFDDKQIARDSHIASAPNAHTGQNFDPKLRVQMANEPGVIHATRPIEPPAFEISDQLQALHDNSKRLYPDLNLSKGEYVIVKLHRHPIGLFAPVAVTTFILSLLVTAWILYPVLLEDAIASSLPSYGLFSVMIFCVMALVSLLGYIAVWVYLRNTFYMTNESVIQEIQHSLFSKHEQTVSLGSVEDVSFIQTGVLQVMFNYGTIRLSTEGEETTYRFHFVSNPKHQVAMLNNAVEDFKNGRPVAGN